jgi:hypothetical protein
MATLSSVRGFSTGGSGSSETLKFIQQGSQSSLFYSSPSYTSVIRTAGGTKGNTFAVIRMEMDTPTATTRCRMYPITVDTTTGAITFGTPANIFSNSSGAATSTTHFNTVDGTGALFIGTHSALPGYGSHYFGYIQAQISSSFAITGASTVASNADHGYNGTFTHLPTSIGSGYMLTAGYNASSSSWGGLRLSSVSSGTMSVGSWSQTSSYTSTTWGIPIVSQPGVYQTGTQVVSMAMTYGASASSLVLRVYGADGNYTDHSVPTGEQYTGLQLADGSVILASSSLTYLFTNRSTRTTIGQVWPFVRANGYEFIGLGQNRFLVNTAYGVCSWISPLVVATVSSTQVTYDRVFDFGPTAKPGFTAQSQWMFPIYASPTNTKPADLLAVQADTSGITAKVFEFPTNL